MSVHIHTLRNCCAKACLLFPAPLLLSWALAPGSPDLELARVSGRVTCAGQPIGGAIHFAPENGRGPSASGLVNPDGSFQLLLNAQSDQQGVVPGTYRVVVRPRPLDKIASRVDRKYQDTRTTDLLVQVVPGWNYVHFNLQ
jgi:hypothetical protein